MQHVSFMMQNKDYVASLTVKENINFTMSY